MAAKKKSTARKSTSKNTASKKSASKKKSARASGGAPDAMTLLRTDHQNVSKMFEQFEIPVKPLMAVGRSRPVSRPVMVAGAG